MTIDTITSKRKVSKSKKSSFYHARWNTVGLNEQRAAELLEVSIEQIQEWDKTGNRLAERFLLLWDRKHISEPGWDGFIFTQGKLKHKNLTWTPALLLQAHREHRHYYQSGLSVIDTEARLTEVLR